MFGAFGGRKSGELDWEGKMGLVLVPRSHTEDSYFSLPEENVQGEDSIPYSITHCQSHLPLLQV